MSLFASLAAAAAGNSMIDIEASASPPVVFPIIDYLGTTYWQMTLTTSRREWVALTLAAAQDAITANDQTGAAPNETYAWSMSETNRVCRAYKVVRMSELRTYELFVGA